MVRGRLAELNNTLNWDSPNGDLRCQSCTGLGKPTAGSYSSSLEDYEDLLGPIGAHRSRARVLILFQDPRPTHGNFEMLPPGALLAEVHDGKHRYFAPSPAAWSSLGLLWPPRPGTDGWPTSKTAPHFIRRYISANGAWSYDGLAAYLLYHLAPEAAIVGNVAKCHFGKSSVGKAAETCVSIKLPAEVSALRPNFAILLARGLRHVVRPVRGMPSNDAFMAVFHPAYTFKNIDARRDMFLGELDRCSNTLSGLGVDVDVFRASFIRDFERARQL